MMPLVELARMPRLSQLKVGSIFEEDEVIVEVDNKKTSMFTVRREEGEETGEEYDIRGFYYDIEHNGRRIISINNNGYCEITLGDKAHRRYSTILTRKGFPKIRRAS